MLRTHLILISTVFFSTGHAEEIQRSTITSCAYQAGTAREIQELRQAEQPDWQTFESNILKIYKDTQGREDLLNIARRVFIRSLETTPFEVHDEIFQACVNRVNGAEPKA